MKSSELDSALLSIPDLFRDQLLAEYSESQRAAASADWEKVGLKAGKICEIAYCILEGICTGLYPSAIAKPQNMQDACKTLESKAKPGTPRSARIQMPRVIAALYELRNNRAIGHAGGDVQPNRMDGLLFNQTIKWLVAEFVRLVSNVSISKATKLVDELSFRWTAAIWQYEDRKRVLIPDIKIKDQVLTLLYFSDSHATIDQLRSWLEVSNITLFRDRQLAPLHKEGLVDLNRVARTVRLLPAGSARVESEILTLLP
jgi:hypothetical protein